MCQCKVVGCHHLFIRSWPRRQFVDGALAECAVSRIDLAAGVTSGPSLQNCVHCPWLY